MLNAEYVSLSRLQALSVQLDVAANNLANMSTTGYKSENTLFQEYLVTLDNGDKVSYVQDWGLMRNTAAGSLTATGNTLDMALDGPGYFSVETADGIRYTRNGNFSIDSEGRLVTSDGNPVLDDTGVPIQFTEFDNKVTVSSDGTISTQAGVVGKLGIVTFADEQLLRKTGNSRYATDQVPQPNEKTAVVQGMIENSNVQPILELTDLIRVQRAYVANQKLLKTTDDLQRKMLQQIGQVL